MNFRWRYLARKNRYTQLLITLGFLFLIHPLIATWKQGYILVELSFLLYNLAIIYALFLPGRTILLLISIAMTSFILELNYFLDLLDLPLGSSFFVDLSNSMFSLLAILAISVRIFVVKKVERDIVHGGVCVFLILGLLWFNFYNIILAFDPNAFDGLSTQLGTRDYQTLYYSFTTLTTLGFGDITPVNKFAMTFSNAEAIIGMLYPSIFIARLVALYTTQELEQN